MENKTWIAGIIGVALISLVAVLLILRMTNESAGVNTPLSPTPTHAVPTGEWNIPTNVPDTPTPTPGEMMLSKENWALLAPRGGTSVNLVLGFETSKYTKSYHIVGDKELTEDGGWNQIAHLSGYCVQGEIKYNNKSLAKFQCEPTESGVEYRFSFDGIPTAQYELSTNVALDENTKYRLRMRDDVISYYCDSLALVTIDRTESEIHISVEGDLGKSLKVTYFLDGDEIDKYCRVEDSERSVCYLREDLTPVWELERYHNGEHCYRLVANPESEEPTVLYFGGYGMYPDQVGSYETEEALREAVAAAETKMETPTYEWQTSTMSTVLEKTEFGTLTLETSSCAIYGPDGNPWLYPEILSRRIRFDNPEWHLAFANLVINPDCRVETASETVTTPKGTVDCVSWSYRFSESSVESRIMTGDGTTLWTETEETDSDGSFKLTRDYLSSDYFIGGTREIQEKSANGSLTIRRVREKMNEIVLRYNFDEGNRLIQAQRSENGQLVEDINYRYDEQGRFTDLVYRAWDMSGKVIADNTSKDWTALDDMAGLY
ncbi:MAG: hypothetical protein J5645_08570 [Lachnospiraceae bacterium]|nr:hypothetical protein [Lachnospiraceae bacterium]